MQFNDAFHQRQPQTEAAVFFGPFYLPERVKKPCQFFGWNPAPGILDRHYSAAAFPAPGNGHAPAGASKLLCVMQQVSNGLLKADSIAMHWQRLRFPRHGNLDIPRMVTLRLILDALLDHVAQVQRYRLQRQLAVHQARHIQQIIHQAFLPPSVAQHHRE
ncbi:MAG: hypothetical protein BWY76_01857 [bacterium ADurb.Bin429]|nr:MAG: hypothetical protein BWY76_01857 [bacterium ADurb.Bin429]